MLEDDFKTYMVAQQVQQKLLVAAASDVKVSRDDVNAEITKIREANDLTDNQKYQDALQQAASPTPNCVNRSSSSSPCSARSRP
ncbi:hypothetical protein CTI14_21095 [Methylobacterium radiotolerans]|nr:hypothetical protein CTI14_21095 [Methylobacterium radiotolerans]